MSVVGLEIQILNELSIYSTLLKTYKYSRFRNRNSVSHLEQWRWTRLVYITTSFIYTSLLYHVVIE